MSIACGCGSSSSDDAGLDAPVADRRELYQFVLEPGPRSTCSWPEVAHPAERLELAEPGTATFLWEWNPEGDPGLEDVLRWRANGVSRLALGPDGSIWAVGPDDTAIINVSRDGHLNFVEQIIRERSDGTILGHPHVLPDGSALIDVRPDWMVRIGPTGGQTDLWRAPGRSYGFSGVGPEGRVYLVDSDEEGTWLVATCRGDIGQWMWRLAVRHPWEDSDALGGPILEDGTILGFRDGAFMHIAPDGSVEWLSEPAPHDASVVTAPLETVRGYRIAQSGSGTMFRHRVLNFMGQETWSRRLPYGTGRSVTVHADAVPHLIVQDYDGEDNSFTVLDAHGRELWSAPFFSPPGFGAFTQGGGWIGGRGAGLDGAVIARIDGDGTSAWEIVVGVPYDGGGNGVLDVDGRYYATVTGGISAPMFGAVTRIVAIQTDALPPRGDVCLWTYPAYDCNAHHSYWMHLYAPTPPTE